MSGPPEDPWSEVRDEAPRAADDAVPYEDDAVPYEVDSVAGATVRPGAPRPSDRPGPAHGRRRHPFRLAAAAIIVVGLIVLIGGYFWVQSEANPSGPPGAQVLVTIPAGTGVNAAGSLLASKGVISSSFAFRIWTQFHSVPGVQAGPYAFYRNSSFGAVEQVFTAGPNVFPLVVPPGFTVPEVAQRIGQLPGRDAATFLTEATDGSVRSPWQPSGVTSLEGLLGTGTYTILPGETDRQVLTQMVDRFDALADHVGLAAGAERLGYTPYQVVKIASIVEKEGVLEKNMGPVARVIYNRLTKGTALQMDSTVLYALGRDGGPVTSADLATPSPYNTYLHTGLPPTPTCFPSEQALRAALDPPAGSWLYFVVVQQDGTEAFSTQYSGQLANEALARQRGLG